MASFDKLSLVGRVSDSVTRQLSKKVGYLAMTEVFKKWTMLSHHWKMAMNRFIVQFEDRLADFI
jgi:transposase-like protein